MIRNASGKRQQYRILEREEGEFTIFVTFQARVLLQVLLHWPVIIPKRKWTPEFEREAVTAKIKQLKKEMVVRLSGRNVGLTETEFNILRSLAIDGASKSQSELWRRRRLTGIEEETERKNSKHPSKAKSSLKGGSAGEKIGRKTATQDALKALESKGLIHIGAPKGTGRSRGCDITVIGLFALLDANLPEIWRSFDAIVASHTALFPLIFDNWQKFIKDKTSNDFKIEIAKYFKDPLHSSIASYSFLRNLRLTKAVEQVLVNDLTRHVVLPYLFPYVYELFLPGYVEQLTYVAPIPTDEEVAGWIDTVKRYKNLKKYLQDELDRLDIAIENFSILLKRWQIMLDTS